MIALLGTSNVAIASGSKVVYLCPAMTQEKRLPLGARIDQMILQMVYRTNK